MIYKHDMCEGCDGWECCPGNHYTRGEVCTGGIMYYTHKQTVLPNWLGAPLYIVQMYLLEKTWPVRRYIIRKYVEWLEKHLGKGAVWARRYKKLWRIETKLIREKEWYDTQN
jgi:hypothetical protein